jgi:heme exporter protein CcmD
MSSIEKLTEFLQMGGFALYVWGAYAISALILAVITFMAIRSLRQSQKKMREIEHINIAGQP